MINKLTDLSTAQLTDLNKLQRSYKKNDSSKTEAKDTIMDSIEISQEAKEAFKNSTENSYDFKEIMRIHEKGFKEIPSQEESDYYWNARKNNEELDTFLYEKDKGEALKLMGKVQAILMKAVTGVPLTKEEEEMVKEDPSLRQEIELRKAQANMMK